MTQTTTMQQPLAATRLRRGAAVLTALCAFGIALYQVLTPGPPGNTYGSLNDWTRDLVFLAYLLSSIFATAACVRDDLAPRASAWLIGVGYALITVGVAIGVVLQHSPDWFMVLGGPGQLLGAAGFLTWAVVGRRRGLLPLWASLLCGIGGVLAILLAEFGTSVLIGAFWLVMAFPERAGVAADRAVSSGPRRGR